MFGLSTTTIDAAVGLAACVIIIVSILVLAWNARRKKIDTLARWNEEADRVLHALAVLSDEDRAQAKERLFCASSGAVQRTGAERLILYVPNALRDWIKTEFEPDDMEAFFEQYVIGILEETYLQTGDPEAEKEATSASTTTTADPATPPPMPDPRDREALVAVHMPGFVSDKMLRFAHDFKFTSNDKVMDLALSMLMEVVEETDKKKNATFTFALPDRRVIVVSAGYHRAVGKPFSRPKLPDQKRPRPSYLKPVK